jgi:hypothetical protein
MPRDDLRFQEPDNPLDDHEDPDESDFDSEESETAPCPLCGAEIYDDAVRCPACGQYIPAETSAWSGRPLWWIFLGLLGIVVVILALLRPG